MRAGDEIAEPEAAVAVVPARSPPGTPRFTFFDTGVPGPSFPVLDETAALWFGNGSGSSQLVRLTGDLGGAPTIGRVGTSVSSIEFPILDHAGNLWWGNTDAGGSDAVVRVSY